MNDDKIDYMLIANFLEENYEQFADYCNEDTTYADEIIEALRKKANETV